MRFTLTAVVCALFLFASAATADTLCSGGLQVITLPENTTEASTVFSCPGFQFGANAGVSVFFETDQITPSDVVILADVAGGSTITFASDLDVPLGLPAVINFQVVEPNAFVVVAASMGGGPGLKFTFTSDVNESAVGSDQVAVESVQNGGGGNPAVPEPSTISLFGLSLLGICRLLRQKKVA